MTCTRRHEHARRFWHRTEPVPADDVPGMVHAARDIASRSRGLESWTPTPPSRSLAGSPDVVRQIGGSPGCDPVTPPGPCPGHHGQSRSAADPFSFTTRSPFLDHPTESRSPPHAFGSWLEAIILRTSCNQAHDQARARPSPDRPRLRIRGAVGDQATVHAPLPETPSIMRRGVSDHEDACFDHDLCRWSSGSDPDTDTTGLASIRDPIAIRS